MEGTIFRGREKKKIYFLRDKLASVVALCAFFFVVPAHLPHEVVSALSVNVFFFSFFSFKLAQKT